jgi:hypothetical protein
MELSPKSSEALNKWLALGTWHTGHPSDMRRFYEFIDHYQKEHGYSLNEQALQEEIAMRANVQGNEMAPKIRDYVSLAFSVLEFLKQTNR